MKRETSSLLIDEDPLQVLPSLATAIGLNEAIALQQLHYWLNRSDNYRSEKRWVYNSYEDWAEFFPFWSYRTIQRTFLALEKMGVVQTDTPGGQDRRKWYTINYALLNSLEIKPKTRRRKEQSSSCQNGASDNANMASSTCQDGIIRPSHSGILNVPKRHDVNKDSEITTETTTEITTKDKSIVVSPHAETTDVQSEKVSKSRIAQAVEVFNYWKVVHNRNGRTIFDAKRRRAVEGRLKDGFDVETLKRAIRGIKFDPHCMGQNEQKKIYDDLELICRDAKHVEDYAALDTKRVEAVIPTAPAPSPPPSYANCPDCHGTNFYYPQGVGKGVVKCSHKQMNKQIYEQELKEHERKAHSLTG